MVSLKNDHPEAKIKLVNFSRNFGKESAIYAGLTHADGDYISLIDADLQQRPEVVLQMLELLESDKELDCVTAYQEKRREGKFMTLCKSMFYKFINAICDIDFHPNASDFRTFRRNVAKTIVDLREYHRFSKGIFSWIGFNTKYIPYTAEERNAGETTWSFKKLLKYAGEGIISFTTFPLRLPTHIGILSVVSALVYLIINMIRNIGFDIPYPSDTAIITLMLMLSGVQLILLGFIGQYLSKMYIEAKKRPVFIEKEYISYEETKQ